MKVLLEMRRPMHGLLGIVALNAFVFVPILSAQDSCVTLPPFEARMVWEVNRHSLEGTLGYSFVRGAKGVLRAEIGVVTIPLVGVSGTYLLCAGDHVKVGPEIGLFLSPISSPVSFCPSAGVLVAISPTGSLDLLMGVRSVWVPGGSRRSMGGSLSKSRVLDLADFPPLVVFIGIAL